MTRDNVELQKEIIKTKTQQQKIQHQQQSNREIVKKGNKRNIYHLCYRLSLTEHEGPTITGNNK